MKKKTKTWNRNQKKALRKKKMKSISEVKLSCSLFALIAAIK
jgi:hypothetical protein